MELLDTDCLTDEQRQVLYLPASGDHVIMGSAGSGKTLMAAHRALQLATGSLLPLSTVLITYTNALVRWLTSYREISEAGILCSTFHRYTQDTFEEWGFPFTYLQGQRRDEYITQALKQMRGQDRQTLRDHPDEFFRRELGWIQGMGIESINEYLDVRRVGRGSALGQVQRRFIWQLFQQYRKIRRPDRIDMLEAGSLLFETAMRRTVPSQHIIIDEGQDLLPETIRGLRAMAGAHGSFTWFGDYDQQIYGRGVSFRSIGLQVGRIHRFTANHRTTQEIGALAKAIQDSEWFDEVEDRIESIPVGGPGEKPVLCQFQSDQDRVEWTCRKAKAHLGNGESVAVLVRHVVQRDHILRELGTRGEELSRNTANFNGGKVFVGTIHSSKGLGFDSVFLPYAGASDIPPNREIEALGRDAAFEQEAKLLYVGATRAKMSLHIGYLEEPSPLLPGDLSFFSCNPPTF